MEKFIERFGENAPLVSIDELKQWIVLENDDVLVINKPGWLVCHPSKNGPMSSLVGACREYTGLEKIHLVARLDRETSGIVVLAKSPASARWHQMAIEHRRVKKSYIAILQGQFSDEKIIDGPLARDMDSPVFVKQTVREDRTAKSAKTGFRPILSKNNYTIAEVDLYTGRKHQIRAHAQFMGHPLVGDKIYGPDDNLYLEFIETGWSERMWDLLKIHRQALHAKSMIFTEGDKVLAYHAPVPSDIVTFCKNEMHLTDEELEPVLNL